MKKIGIPSLALVLVLMFATPAFAADENTGGWFSGFAKFFQMFGLFKNDMPPIDDFGNIKLSPTVTVTLPPENDETRDGKKYIDRPGIPERPITRWPTKEPRPTDRFPTKPDRPPEERPTDRYSTKPVRPPEERPTKDYEPTGSVRPTRSTQPPEDPIWKNSFERAPRGPSGANGKDTKEIINAIVSRMFDGYENRLSHYQDFLVKVKSRRDKLAENSDVTKLDAFIETATENHTAAKQKFAEVKAKASAVTATDSMKNAVLNIRDLLRTLRLSMTTLHKSMSEVVAEIVKSSGPAGATGSEFKSKMMRPGIPTGEWGADTGGKYMQGRSSGATGRPSDPKGNRPATGAWGGGGGN